MKFNIKNLDINIQKLPKKVIFARNVLFQIKGQELPLITKVFVLLAYDLMKNITMLIGIERKRVN